MRPGYLNPEMARCAWCDARCSRRDLAAHEAECSGRERARGTGIHSLALSHFSADPVTAILAIPKQSAGFKPNGFWVSVDGEDDWESWCRSEDFAIHRLAVRHRITLAPAPNILWLNSIEDIDAFTDRYLSERKGSPRYHRLEIDWPAVSDAHDGIIIAPYQWERRLGDRTLWYYGWDCASGCIWQPRAVNRIEVISDLGQEAA